MAAVAILVLVAVAILAGATIHLAGRVEKTYPAIGRFADIDGIRLHYLEGKAGPKADLAPMLFLHGASGNARDLHGAFAEPLNGRARLLFVDRPGAGYSGRAGGGDAQLEAQADYLDGLLHELGMDRVVVVGHSLGSAVALALAVRHPRRVAGLMLIAPVSHPWPGGATTWYYSLTNLPFIGPAFAHLLAVPAGNLRYASAVKAVFLPNAVAQDYETRSATRLVLRPENFLANAADVGSVYAGVSRLSPHYGAIRVATTIVTGDADSTVRADIHSDGLARDIAGARLVVVPQTGHMPTYTATFQIVSEIETMQGRIAVAAGE